MLEQIQQHQRESGESTPGQRLRDRRQDEHGHTIWRHFLTTPGAVPGKVGIILAFVTLLAAVYRVVHLLLFSGSLY
jgi:hypothetical protein